MHVLIVRLSTPWAIFQKYNCSHNEERGACLLLTLIAQGFELSLGGGLRKKTQRLQQCLPPVRKLWKLLQIEVSYFCVCFSVV